MKKFLALFCVICLTVVGCVACGGSEGGDILAGKTYVIDDVRVELGDSMTEAEKAQMKSALVQMDASYADMTLEEIFNDMMAETIDTLKDDGGKFIFKEDGVFESVGGGLDETGTYKIEGKKVLMTIEDETTEATISGKKLLITEEADGGLVIVMEMIQE